MSILFHPPPTCVQPSPSAHPTLTNPRINRLHTTTRVSFSTQVEKLTTPPWRFILLSDGHIHNLLSHLLEHPLTLTLHSTQRLPHPPPPPPPPHHHQEQERLPREPCVRRTITLNGQDGTPLLHASSTWRASSYERIMSGWEGASIYHVFSQLRLAMSRAILAVHFVTCEDLCPLFSVRQGSYMWARDYVFRQQGIPFVVVQEVFSPRLQQYLGDIVPPQQLTFPTSPDQQHPSVQRVVDHQSIHDQILN